MTFDDWYGELCNLAENDNVLWLVGVPQDHKQDYEDGNEPKDVLFNLKMDAADQ